MKTLNRPFRNDAELPALLRFAAEATQLRLPRKAQWHIGDITWWLSDFDSAAAVRGLQLWYEGTRVVGIAWFESPGHLRIETLDEDSLVDEMLQFCDAKYVGVFDSDKRRIEQLTNHAYQRSGPAGIHLRCDLSNTPLPKPELPDGMSFRDSRDIDVAERVAVHVDAWSHLAHIGLPDARSKFSARRYERMRRSTTFLPDLDVVVATAGGQYVSCATCWADPESGVGLTEPVGTHHAFRRRGLSRAINLECLRRLREHGMSTAVIQTAPFNTAARATYLSCGYELVDQDSWFLRRTPVPATTH